MNNIKSGGILIGIGIVLNLILRLFAPMAARSRNVPATELLAIFMLVSAIIVLFGLYRLIVGIATRKR